MSNRSTKKMRHKRRKLKDRRIEEKKKRMALESITVIKRKVKSSLVGLILGRAGVLVRGSYAGVRGTKGLLDTTYFGSGLVLLT